MGFKYAIRSDKLHFLTHTVVDWIDVFTRRELAIHASPDLKEDIGQRETLVVDL